jgi:hypothetical protein
VTDETPQPALRATLSPMGARAWFEFKESSGKRRTGQDHDRVFFTIFNVPQLTTIVISYVQVFASNLGRRAWFQP